MKKVLSIILFFNLFTSCVANKNLISQDVNLIKKDENLIKDTDMNNNIKQNIEIIAIPEMEGIPNFNLSYDNELKDKSFEISKDKAMEDLTPYIEKIKSVNFVDLSKWSKSEMTDYKLKDERFRNLKNESIYYNKSDYLVKIKLDSLPTNSPIVIRDLYLFNVYDSDKNLKTIYVTIQGHLEE